MIEAGGELSHLVFLTGGAIVMTMLIKGVMERTVVPPLVGFLVLGICLRWGQTQWPLAFEGGGEVIAFLSKLGLVTLLFRVGMKSDITVLAGQLKNASIAWILNIGLTGLAGFYTASLLLGQALVPSLIVAVAFTATSVGVSVKVWEDQNALQSKNGGLLVDLAELDDVTAVLLMGLLFAVVPYLPSGSAPGSFWPVLGQHALGFVAKLLLFAGGCLVFAAFLERPMTRFLKRVEHTPDSTLTIVGLGFVIAALAGGLGFSLAIGAFFAGLTFSRDPECVTLDTSFTPIFDFFSPFFFVGIGFEFELATLGPSLGMGGLLLVLAVLVKVIANGVPVALLSDGPSGWLIGASMIPRAEIALVIMQKGLHLDTSPVSEQLFGAMVVVSALSCVLAPIVVRGLLQRWPQTINRRSGE
ncbi:cation:proton antiporter [Desulfohalobium retbaense]|uniref:Sodium/hydrogen exchanger n=1 Tax=Desulfohalobium retbaense (strain ATCC 49708 / DSM 5692 / JCM 16813 / HR100) TaxID=485915 RepID=C8X198_DESRD|nr:cation:proton antiporter [Desulfohalobium retbaense]ACV68195.1 sodium/hydrogen exchanger [Desulfohalobium retbaense DSM 5692]